MEAISSFKTRPKSDSLSFFKNLHKDNFIGGTVLYFDSFRYLPNIAVDGPNSYPLPKNSRENSMASSISRISETSDQLHVSNKFLNLKQWLINLDFIRLKQPNSENQKTFEHIIEAFNTLFNPFIFSHISEKGEILFNCNNIRVNIDQLSDGFKNLFIIIGEIFYRLYNSSDGKADFYNYEAVVLIDEIDCHIHPKWQINIIPYFKQMFPNCQFIITTHSPFILNKLDDSEITELEGVLHHASIDRV
ncbi:AAA family ATPase [Paenibacillus sp. FSL P4-0338]|uniref:AAA family ATPase n=1 Tax=Paenibacillus sp. FSL P4-0338 TaxID=2921635 RepID=UPI0030FBE08E